MFQDPARRAGIAVRVAPSLVLAADADAPFTLRSTASVGPA